MIDGLAKLTKKLFERKDNHYTLSNRFTLEKIDYLSHSSIEWADLFLLEGKIELHGRRVFRVEKSIFHLKLQLRSHNKSIVFVLLISH